MPYYKGDPDYLASPEDSDALIELKEMQRTMSWQKYLIPNLSPFLSLNLFIPANTVPVTPAIPAGSSLLMIEGKKSINKLFHFLLGLQKKLDEQYERIGKSNSSTKKSIKLLGSKQTKHSNDTASSGRFSHDVPVLYLLIEHFISCLTAVDILILPS